MNEVHVNLLEHKNYKVDVLLEISSVKWDLNGDPINAILVIFIWEDRDVVEGREIE